MFEGTEVGSVQEVVGIENTHDADTVEVESLGNHLRTYKQIGASCTEVADDAFIGLAGAGGVEIHACHTSLRENVAHIGLYFLRTIAACLEHRVSTGGTLHRHLIGIAAVVA